MKEKIEGKRKTNKIKIVFIVILVVAVLIYAGYTAWQLFAHPTDVFLVEQGSISEEIKAEGYIIYICSASAEAYLRFCKLPVDEILGTKTLIKENKYTSQMLGNNCKNEEKVKRIQEVIKNHNLEIDYDLSYAYSDSLHDIPMLKMVKNRIKIDTKDGHMSTFEIE